MSHYDHVKLHESPKQNLRQQPFENQDEDERLDHTWTFSTSDKVFHMDGNLIEEDCRLSAMDMDPMEPLLLNLPNANQEIELLIILDKVLLTFRRITLMPSMVRTATSTKTNIIKENLKNECRH
jgi:hypothetical protein